MRLGAATCLLLSVLAARSARADDQEAYLTLEAGPALLRTEQRLGEGGGMANVAAAGATAQLAYGLTDTLHLDLALGGLLGVNAEYHGVTVDGDTQNVFQDVLGVRATAGVTARFGARFIPTLGLHAGYQHRILMNAELFDDRHYRLERLPGGHEDEVVGIVSAGLELRLDRHWHVGIAAQAVLAVGGQTPFLSIEVPVRLSYAFYPRLFRSMRLIRFED